MRPAWILAAAAAGWIASSVWRAERELEDAIRMIDAYNRARYLGALASRDLERPPR